MTIIQKYSHDFKNMAMTEEELGNMLNFFAKDLLAEIESKNRENHSEHYTQYYRGYSDCISDFKEQLK